MRIIRQFLVLLLMSMMTSVVHAQTSKITNVALSTKDIATIKRALVRNKELAFNDSALVESLIQNGNTPLNGVIKEENDFMIITDCRLGDEWTAFICKEDSSFWLVYIINRKKQFICRYSVSLY